MSGKTFSKVWQKEIFNRLDKVEGHLSVLNKETGQLVKKVDKLFEENDDQNIAFTKLGATLGTKMTLLLWGLPTFISVGLITLGFIIRYAMK